MGTAGCMRQTISAFGGEDVLVLYGDVFVDMDLKKLIDFLNKEMLKGSKKQVRTDSGVGIKPISVFATKRLVRMAAFEPLAEVRKVHAELQQSVFASEDAREGARAFAEKRFTIHAARQASTP